VQVDPIKPTLKLLAYKRLKLEDEKLLSNFAFNFNLRRCSEDVYFGEALRGEESEVDGYDLVAGVYTRPPFGST